VAYLWITKIAAVRQNPNLLISCRNIAPENFLSGLSLRCDIEIGSHALLVAVKWM
jgi:hypothetical protein